MPQQDAAYRNIGWLAIAAAFFWLLYLLAPVLTPFFLAAILAYMGQPLVIWLSQRGVPRTLAVLAFLLVEAMLVVALVLAVLPMFVREVSQAVHQLPTFLDRLDGSLAPWLRERTGIAISLDAESLKQWLRELIASSEGLGMQALRSVGLGGLGLIGLIANAVLVPVVQFFLMRDWESMLGRIESLIPPAWRTPVRDFVAEANEALGQYLHGQMLVIAIMATFYTAALWLTGLDSFLPIGIITGVLVFVPFLGSTTGFLLATLAAVMQFDEWTRIIWVWGVFVAGQMIEGYVVVPKLVGERIGLHPLAVIFALLAFGQIFGFFGLLLALPASAVLLVGLQRLKARYLASGLYRSEKA
jgi:predicted PurR-regulated permease PerM